MTPDDFFERLAAPFPADAISWRVGSTNIDKSTNKPREGQEPRGLALAYLDARDVADRLDEVCGAAGWQCRYSHVGPTTVCDIGVWSTLMQEWLWKADGAGATDVEAEKGMLSDSFKRAAVRWGIGRYLYGLPSPWVALEAKGRSWVISQPEYKKLEDLLEKYTGDIEWGTPAERAAARAMVVSIKSVVHTSDDVRRYREQNDGSIGQLRVKARACVMETLERIAEGSQAAA
jgi:hypothetical protein